MIRRALLGTAVGSGLGTVYGAFGHCLGGRCMTPWSTTTPIWVGAALGLLVVLTSRWD